MHDDQGEILLTFTSRGVPVQLLLRKDTCSSLQPSCLGETELVQLITPTINAGLTPSSPEQRPRVLGLQAAFPTAENKHRAISLQDLLF